MSQPTDVRDDRRYTKEHEWALTKDGDVVVGISAFAVDQLGDITLVNWNVVPGAKLAVGDVFGTIESVKTLSDLFAPVAGTVVRVNSELESAPERVNDDCWDQGWMLVLRPDDPAAVEGLMTSATYRQHIASLEH